jgi:starch synthase (maltosyl-transferring)
MSFATAPRIYCINPALVAHQGWPALLDHCVALGFDHVLLANALNLGQSPGIDDRPALAELTAACSDRGLCLLLDIVLDRVSSEDPLIDACPGWFENKSSPESKSLADGPSVASDSVAHLRMADSAIRRGVYALWCERLRDWLDVGVAGFVCSAPAAVPVALWRDLMAATRGYRNSVSFLAWTPGSSAPQLDPLTDAGFDAVFCPGAWWDYQATRYVREQDNLIGDATIIAFPETPFGPRLAGQLSLTDVPSRRRASLRALRFAAASGNGILIPMGFELGLTVPFDTVLTPAQYASLCGEAEIDLCDEIQQANRFIVDTGRDFFCAPV